MKILLINNNPVVSRLTALSARKENIEIDEIQEVTKLNSDSYDIVFVDADSYSKDVRETITNNIKVQKSVLFYAEGDEEDTSLFDLSILKPFLPSEVSAVIRSVEENSSLENQDPIREEKNFDILDDSKASNRDELFTLNDLTDEVKETKDTFDEKLEEAFPLKINTLDDDLFEDKKESKEDKKIEKIQDEELFELDLNEDSLIVEDEPSTTEILDFEVEKDEFELDSFEEEAVSKVENEHALVLEDDNNKIEESVEKKSEEVKEEVLETKILDETEIENIKGLLSEDVNDEVTLEELMPTPPVIENEKKPKKKKAKKEKNSLKAESGVIFDTLSSLPVENLRELLAGARVNINIKFPKAK